MNTIRFMSCLDRPWPALLIAGCYLSFSPARAQTPPSSADAAARPVAVAKENTVPTVPEEVQVTGQRKSETLQKAPVSVVVLSKSTLDAAGVKQASDFVALAPGVSLVANTAEVGDSQVNIRGINSARDAGSPSPTSSTASCCQIRPPSTGSIAISARSRSSRVRRTPSMGAALKRAPSW